MTVSTPVPSRERLRLGVRGIVQGVGFRPFVYRLATELGLAGTVRNTPDGAVVEIEGPPGGLEDFARRLESEKPSFARIADVERSVQSPTGEAGFSILASAGTGKRRAIVVPDLATCPDCRREIFDPTDRRAGYPFTSCTRCGPRYSILERLPFDRANTSMKGFPMCARCREEFESPRDRRFHAQTISCPDCGPHITAWAPTGLVIAERGAALLEAAESIRRGRIVAMKGLGGFLLLCDARDERAVRGLRERKGREAKPFALLAGSLAEIRRHATLSEREAAILASPEAPIVLLRSRHAGVIAPSVAPDLSTLGFMLPSTPLHELLVAELGFPVVATSGNVSEEPLCVDEQDALDRLDTIADLFLVHNRPILRPVDDSVVRVALGRPLLLRRARGYAPTLVDLPAGGPSVLAVGGHMKNTVAASDGRQAYLSPHVGTLDTVRSLEVFRATIDGIGGLFEHVPALAVCDLHPAYASTRHAEETGLPLLRVQHHLAHVLACVADNGLKGPVLGVAWDGTGWGTDTTVWGGEFLAVDGASWERLAHLRTFPLPGGERAVREPRRAALGMLHEIFGDRSFLERDIASLQAFSTAEFNALWSMLRHGVNSPATSSAGRLFDAVASLAGLRQRCEHEGQAAMELEDACGDLSPRGDYYLELRGDVLDWEPLVLGVIEDARRRRPVARIATEFHESIAGGIVQVARSAGRERVVLAGGCFQNARLLDRTVSRLRAAGFLPSWPRGLPPNDGGIAIGQIVAALQGWGSCG